MSMTQPVKLLLIGISIVLVLCGAAPDVSAQTDITLVSHVPAELMEGEALREALEQELNVLTTLRAAPTGPTVQVEADTLQAVRVSFLREDKPPVERTVDVSTQAGHATGIVALLASNLVRDEAGELLAQLPAAKPVAPPPPPPPPTATQTPPPHVFRNTACEPNKLRYVTIGADVVPFLGTSTRHGTTVERGISLNLFGGITGGVRGLELAGVFNIDRYTLCGAQFSGTFNFVGGDAAGAQFSEVNIVGGSMYGAQFSQANIVGGDMEGAQFGLFNLSAGFMDGAQFGLANIIAQGLDGAQLGLANIAAGEANGAQLGLFNLTGKTMDGAMIGLVNVAEDADAAIGLVNVIWNGRAQLDVWATDAGLIMAGATQGAKYTHNIYGIGFKPMGDTPAFAWTLGFGVRVVSYSWLTVDIDALGYGLLRKNPETGRADMASIQQLRIPISFAVLRGVWLFVAPSFSVSIAETESHLQKVALFGSDRVTADDASTTVRLWGGASLGARFF
jgi:uncharacterized protein YjbI with pentapeptide repeats